MSHRALGLQFKHTPYDSGEHSIQAIHPEHGVVGELDLHPGGTVSNIYVETGHTRQGVGTGLWSHAKELAAQGTAPRPRHSRQRTGSGDAWARKVGGYVPPLS